MQPAWRRALAAGFVVGLAVSMSGCLTVYPLRSAIAASEGQNNIDYIVVVAYEMKFDASTCIPPDSGADSRSVYVPPFSQYVDVIVQAKLSTVPPEIAPFDSRHFDFTVADGNGTAWVDIHLQNNQTQKEIRIEGPRPGGWSVTLSWAMMSCPPAPVQDNFLVRVLVRQPA